MKTIARILVCFIFMIGASGSFAETSELQTVMPSIPTWWGHSWGIGARDLGLGGAFSAVGGEYASLYYNPAGLGTIQQKEAYGSFSRLSVSNVSNFLGTDNTKQSDVLKMNALGFSFPIPTARGSLVLSFGYHKTRQADNSLFATKFISTPGDSVTWNNRQVEKGWMSNTAFGGAVEVSPGFFLGGSLQFWGGENDFTWLFQEMDDYNIYTFAQFDSLDHIFTTFSGANLTFGGFYKSEHVNIGGSLSTPFTLKCNEDWSYQDVTSWDPDISAQTDEVADQGKVEYKISLPLSLRAGMALTYGPALVSGDIELINYNQIEYRTDPSLASLDKAMANLAIQDNLRNAVNYSLGAELSIPKTPLKIRGGYAFIQTPFQNSAYETNREVYSFGAGFAFSDRLVLDAGYAQTKWEGPRDNLIWKQNIDAKQVLVSVLYKM